MYRKEYLKGVNVIKIKGLKKILIEKYSLDLVRRKLFVIFGRVILLEYWR